jgi:replicative DNA helicase
VPPHDLDAEESLLGAMLLSSDAVAAAVETCSAADFYKPSHGHVFSAIVSLFEAGEPVDAVTVADELRRRGLIDQVGDPTVLVSLQANTPSLANAGHYARIVEEHALLRRLIGVAGELAELGYAMPDDVTAAIDEAERLVFDLSERRTVDSVESLRNLIGPSLDRIEELSHRSTRITGVATGYAELDDILAGLQPASLTIVGARPAMGKTSFALGMLAHVGTVLRRPALLFSLEMGHLELTQRLLASEARVDSQRMRTGHLHDGDWAKVGNAVSRLSESTIFIDENPHLTVMDIRARARRLKKTEGDLGLVVVDYLQLMTGRGKAENRQVEVSEISRGLKILARELECPVVALSQLSRNLEARQDKRPMLSDLRESGCMPATTRLLRADTGEEVTLGELVLSQERPLVWSLDDETWTLVPRRLVKAFPTGRRPVLRLRLRSGYEVEATANHQFRTVDGWRRLDEIDIGEHVAVPRRVGPPTARCGDWSDDELVLLAHLIGGGSIGPKGVTYVTRDPASKRVVEETARRLLDVDVVCSLRGDVWRLRLFAPRSTERERQVVRNWLEPYGLWGSRACETFIPEPVLGLGERQLGLFLWHLWATGGSIRSSRGRGRGRGPRVCVSYVTTSRRLADGVKRALVRLGIGSRVAPARKAGRLERWSVIVTDGTELERFLDLVGCPRTRSGSPAPALAALASKPGSDAEPHLAARPALAVPDVFWDEVVEITPAGVRPTFDATVEGTHNFIANGVIAHNSLEQDADVVLFIFREELYDPETPIDRRGLAEIIVAKHRNGPTGSAHLVFLSQYARFDNLQRV